jgi:8-oxo-dGTP pyrophosphatase MutT (NUDIX family)
VNKTARISIHAKNQLNYIKVILSQTKIINIKKNKTAAVMVILTIVDNQLNVLFTHRTSTVSTHKDQVSFPGGLKETNDNDLIQTALRETEEEIGLIIDKKEILGCLPIQKSISGFQIHPFVCFIDTLPDLMPNSKEVRHFFTIPLDWILNRKNWDFQIYKSSDAKERQVVVFQNYQNEVVWGITGQILVSFTDLLLF